MGAMLRDLDRNTKGYEDLAGKSPDEDLLVIALTEMRSLSVDEFTYLSVDELPLRNRPRWTL